MGRLATAIMEDHYGRLEKFDMHVIAAKQSLHNSHVKAFQFNASVDLSFFNIWKPGQIREHFLLRMDGKPAIGPDFGRGLNGLLNAHVWAWWQNKMMQNWDFLNGVVQFEAIKRGVINGPNT